jgi:hypothetical protein
MTQPTSQTQAVPDELKYVKPWEFVKSPSKPIFEFNAYWDLRVKGAIYDDQPAWELQLQAEVRRHEKQQIPGALKNNNGTKLLPGLLNDWSEIAAAIYSVTLSSELAGKSQDAYLRPIIAMNGGMMAGQSGQQETPLLLGVTPDQPINRSEKSNQVRTSSPITSKLRPLCLFNVIAACEWWPISEAYQRELMWAFRRMSDFLFDVTDGYMALGHVAIGDASWMNCADIQILASNRLHPRSWVSGMQLPEKYMPIRVGRGRWNKQVQRAIPWDEPEGYRDLVHEWAHYALGLKDHYLGVKDAYLLDNQLTEIRNSRSIVRLAVPKINLPLESVMSQGVGTSELVSNLDNKGKDSEWANLKLRFPDLPIPGNVRANTGPGALPLPLPEIQFIAATDNALEQEPRFWPPVYDPKATDKPAEVPIMDVNHCWVFTVRGLQDDETLDPKNLIAHGTLEARSITEGFALPGAQPGDTVVLIGDGLASKNTSQKPLVLMRKLGALNEVTYEFSLADAWLPKTPASFPLVDVYPTVNSSQNTDLEQQDSSDSFQIQVEINTDRWRGWIFPLGTTEISGELQWSQNTANPKQSRAGEKSDASAKLSSLDGHILLMNDAHQVTVAAYSIGGGPASVGVPWPAPITAGSSEGNAMIFFYDKQASVPPLPDEATLTVTTRNYGISNGYPDYQTCSYTYSLVPNRPLPSEKYGTLVMAIDRTTVGEDEAVELRRFDPKSGTWAQKVPALYDAVLSNVAAPLYGDAEARYQPAVDGLYPSAPGLFAGEIVAERYQLVKRKK